MSPEAQGTPLANVLSDIPNRRLGDFGVNQNQDRGAASRVSLLFNAVAGDIPIPT